VSIYDNVGQMYKALEYMATKLKNTKKSAASINPLSIDATSCANLREYPHKSYVTDNRGYMGVSCFLPGLSENA